MEKKPQIIEWALTPIFMDIVPGPGPPPLESRPEKRAQARATYGGQTVVKVRRTRAQARKTTQRSSERPEWFEAYRDWWYLRRGWWNVPADPNLSLLMRAVLVFTLANTLANAIRPKRERRSPPPVQDDPIGEAPLRVGGVAIEEDHVAARSNPFNEAIAAQRLEPSTTTV